MKSERKAIPKNCPYVVELPAGMPVNTGPFGTFEYDSSRKPSWFFWLDWDLLFVMKGCARFKFRNGSVFEVPENHFLLIPPTTTILQDIPKLPTRFFFFHFSFYPFPDRVFPSVRKNCMELSRTVRIPCIFSKQEAPDVWKAYRELLEKNFPTAKPPWEVPLVTCNILSALGAFALRLNYSSNRPTLNPREGMDPRVIQIFKRIAQNPAFPWKVSEMAKSINVSRQHLDYLCQRSVGDIKLKSFIIEERLIHAARLLEVRDGKPLKSIKQIGAECGFRSPQFFCRQFKKFHGVPPQAYRRRITEM